MGEIDHNTNFITCRILERRNGINEWYDSYEFDGTTNKYTWEFEKYNNMVKSNLQDFIYKIP